MNLRKKPTFNELINYIEVKQPKIKYPDRSATILRNSHYLSQFDGNLFDLEEHQKHTAKAQLRETEIRYLYQTGTSTATLLRGDAAQEQNRRTTAQATRSSVSTGATIGREPQTDAETEAKQIVASAVANAVANVVANVAKAKEKAAKPKKPKDVEITGISVNKSQDIKFWKEQSANEIRAQFKLRDLKKDNEDYAFKTKVQLLELIKELIKNKQW